MFWIRLFFILASTTNASPLSEGELLKRQQSLYSEKQWDAFFGGAVYLREHTDGQFMDYSQALEIMALARHCQWPIIESLAANITDQEPLSQRSLRVVRMKKGYLKFLNDMQHGRGKISEQIKILRKDWPLSQEKLQKLTSPERVRVHVRSLCKE